MPGFDKLVCFQQFEKWQNSKIFWGSVPRTPLDEAHAFGTRSPKKLTLWKTTNLRALNHVSCKTNWWQCPVHRLKSDMLLNLSYRSTELFFQLFSLLHPKNSTTKIMAAREAVFIPRRHVLQTKRGRKPLILHTINCTLPGVGGGGDSHI